MNAFKVRFRSKDRIFIRRHKCGELLSVRTDGVVDEYWNKTGQPVGSCPGCHVKLRSGELQKV